MNLAYTAQWMSSIIVEPDGNETISPSFIMIICWRHVFAGKQHARWVCYNPTKFTTLPSKPDKRRTASGGSQRTKHRDNEHSFWGSMAERDDTDMYYSMIAYKWCGIPLILWDRNLTVCNTMQKIQHQVFSKGYRKISFETFLQPCEFGCSHWFGNRSESAAPKLVHFSLLHIKFADALQLPMERDVECCIVELGTPKQRAHN